MTPAKHAAFRADPRAVPAGSAPSHRQAVCLLLALLLVAGAVAVVSAVVRPDEARSFDMYGGSIFLADQVAPVAVDLATGRPTVRLVDAAQQVGAKRADQVGVVPTGEGTLLVNRTTGEFNMVDATGFVIKTDGGVPLPRRDGATGAFALAAGDLAYVAQTGPTGTSAYVVNSATVQRATNAATVKPRAFLSMSQPVSPAPGAAVTAGDDLWLLAGSGAVRSLRHLGVRPDSAPGSMLQMQDLGGITGAAALASADDGTRTLGPGATVSATDPGPGTVGVVDRERIRVFRGGQTLLDRAIATPAGLDTVLAAHDSATRLSWLLHGDDGWSVVSVGADGTGLRGPTRIADLDADTPLVAPALSNGWLFTVDTTDGALLQIDGSGKVQRLEGMSSYPVASQDGRTIEAAGFTDAGVIARGPRVIVNSPNHLLAVAVFTDGSRAPVRIQKSSAINVNAGGGAEALARDRAGDNPSQPPPTPGRRTPTPAPAQPVNTSVDCTATSQRPHIPAFGQPVPGSRSVQLSWTYPVTDRGDCIPSTYVVDVRALSGSAPSGPSSVTVQGQEGVNLVGLFPSTRYELRVTALLNGKGTTSAPIQVTTGPEGPKAPTGVTARADASGNWTVAWRSCGTESDGCVPAQTWRVIPQFCDGRGLSAAPTPLEVAADPTSSVQPGATLRGGSALLGRSLDFQVVGVGADGSVGAPSATSGCVASWSPPNTAALRLTASNPADTDAGGTTSTTLSLSLGDDPVAAVGGVGATVTFVLTGPNGAQTSATTVDGRTGTLTHTFDGVRPGVRYTASARVSPPGHPEAAVSVDAGAITSRARWPGIAVTAQCPSDGALSLSCTLAVNITGVSSVGSGGELFDLTGDSVLQCGQASAALTRSGFDPSTATISQSVSQLRNLYGQCTVRVGLVESASNTGALYYGGVPSPVVSAAVNLGAPTTADLDAGDFAVSWDGGSVVVDYVGSKNLSDLTTNWRESVAGPDGSACGSAARQPDTSVSVEPGCIDDQGSSDDPWTVTIQYDDARGGDTRTITKTLGKPDYQSCAPGFGDATWSGTVDAPTVTVSAASGELSGCSDWTLTLRAPDDSTCGTSSQSPDSDVIIAATCANTPTATGWRVTISWTRSAGSGKGTTINVGGEPPA